MGAGILILNLKSRSDLTQDDLAPFIQAVLFPPLHVSLDPGPNLQISTSLQHSCWTFTAGPACITVRIHIWPVVGERAITKDPAGVCFNFLQYA